MGDKKDFISRKKAITPQNNLMVYGKLPPQAPDLESAVLGAIMLEKTAFDNVIGILKSECFYSEANKLIFKAFEMLQQRNMPIDLLTVVEQLKFNGDLELVGGVFALSKHTNSVVSSSNIIGHAAIVKQKFIQREIIRISGELIGLSYDDGQDAFDLLDHCQNLFTQLSMGNSGLGYKSFQSIAIEAINEIEEARKKGEEITGVDTGFEDLNMVTCGLQKSDLIILAARPGVGKTAFSLKIAKSSSTSKIKPVSVGFFSLEMKNTQLVKRVLSEDSEVWLHHFKNGKISDEGMQKVHKSLVNLKDCKIFIDETPSLPILQFKSKARMLKLKEDIGLIIVDYLQLMKVPGEKNREREISIISQELKATAKELDIPIIALSQLSREIEKRSNGEPQLSDLRESGAIEQDADMVMFLYGASEAEIAQDASLQGAFNLKCCKHRNGDLFKMAGKWRKEIQKYLYLKVVDSSTFKPLGDNWNPVASLPSIPSVDYSVPTKFEVDGDMPF